MAQKHPIFYQLSQRRWWRRMTIQHAALIVVPEAIVVAGAYTVIWHRYARTARSTYDQIIRNMQWITTNIIVITINVAIITIAKVT